VTSPQVYVLAAGRGRRAGGPKAWRPHAGGSLLEHHVRFLRRHLPTTTVTVSIQRDWLERCRSIDAALNWVPVSPSGTPLAALLELVSTVPLVDWSFVYHVDMPVWSESLFDALRIHIPVAEANGADAIVPEYGGRGGHPVLIAPTAAGSLVALDPATDRLDRWLRSRHVERLRVDEPCILENWNTDPVKG
jgi:CTP:molybdopterin cytidylyltransferase MocA